jgi:hypothetical protein
MKFWGNLMSSRVQHFAFACCVQLLLPLMPLLLEFWIRGGVSDQTYTIIAAMYSISIGVTTKNIGMLGVSIFVAMAFSSAFGYVTSGQPMHFSVAIPAQLTIISFILIHGVERYQRHVLAGEKFIEFGEK